MKLNNEIILISEIQIKIAAATKFWSPRNFSWVEPNAGLKN